MSAQKIGTVVIGDELCDILKSDRTGRFGVLSPTCTMCNYYPTQEVAIEKAKFAAGEAYNLARKMLAN